MELHRLAGIVVAARVEVADSVVGAVRQGRRKELVHCVEEGNLEVRKFAGGIVAL